MKTFHTCETEFINAQAFFNLQNCCPLAEKPEAHISGNNPRPPGAFFLKKSEPLQADFSGESERNRKWQENCRGEGNLGRFRQPAEESSENSHALRCPLLLCSFASSGTHCAAMMNLHP
ncbi:hypothetical protein AVEN_154260-1 [Araneus ventricosus]|uniref:Uncharacterized protein n=1 Tax=Araneus ventricosus TaxID=182803 RepID=A0A4Y2JIT1_ARAVE|nr:hypothetical protein AVEN_154260-1 [Araneus ventricosus]